MPNTSATGGYLQGSAPIGRAQIEDAIQKMVVGITGLHGSLVRPNYQADMPKVPEVGVDWCGFGITAIKKLDYAGQAHISDGDGSQRLERHELLTVEFSFYGENGLELAEAFRDGLLIEQNFEGVQPLGIAYRDCGDVTLGADLINEQWVRRYVLTTTFALRIDRIYAVKNLLSAPFNLHP